MDFISQQGKHFALITSFLDDDWWWLLVKLYQISMHVKIIRRTFKQNNDDEEGLSFRERLMPPYL